MLCPRCTPLQSWGSICDCHPPRSLPPSLALCLPTHSDAQAAFLTSPGAPGSSRLGLPHSGPLSPAPWASRQLQVRPLPTKATYLGLPFALAGAARVLIGGPLCGLWEEHTDITWLCHSQPGPAVARLEKTERWETASHGLQGKVPLTTSLRAQQGCQTSLPGDILSAQHPPHLLGSRRPGVTTPSSPIVPIWLWAGASPALPPPGQLGRCEWPRRTLSPTPGPE